jgi:hypothetical protein
MNKILITAITLSGIIVSWCFTFIPESIFAKGIFGINCSKETIIILNRVSLSILIWVITSIFLIILLKKIYFITICSKGVRIKVEYGNILEMRNCYKVINFDECFTTKVGIGAADIKPTSLCGQFLSIENVEEIENAVSNSGLQSYCSEYQNKKCYESGRLVQYKDYLLLAFAKLNSDGLGQMNREQYLQCLNILWKELDKYYAQQDVAITILGSGITRFKGENLSQQELVDIMIASYKLSPYHIKNELRIVCRRSDDFSLKNIGDFNLLEFVFQLMKK